MEKPIISVITPAFNRAKTIRRAILSVLSQTYKNWELIIIDDKSTDNTEEIVTEFKEKDQRITYIKLDKNIGPGRARNVGLENAKGEYIAFLDSDDEWLTKKLEKQLEIFQENDAMLGIVYTGAFFVDESAGTIRTKHAIDNGNLYEKEIAYNPVGGPSRIMTKFKCLQECGFFDENLWGAEDWDLWIRITKKYKVRSIDIPLVKYFETENSMTANINVTIEAYENIYKKYNLSSQKRWIQSIHFFRLGHTLCYKGNMKIGRKYFYRSIVIEPWNAKHTFSYLISFLGPKIYHKITFLIMKNYEL